MNTAKPLFYTIVVSPLGPLLLTGDGEALTGLYMADHLHGPAIAPTWLEAEGVAPFAATREQLASYFAGALRDFDLPLNPAGTPFQQSVWHALRGIPFGQTSTYGAIARQVDTPNASRAVGLANGRNPLSIIVPCHRVVGAFGALTGYGGGLARKAWLLAHEQGGPLPSASGPRQLALTL